MKSLTLARFIAGASATALFGCSLAAAQMSAEKVAATNKILQQVKASIKKLSPSHQMALDGYANISHLADTWKAYGMRLTDPTFKVRPNLAGIATPSGSIVAVSNPSTDVAFSSFGGFTQSETSTARCGNSVVVGYNDSGSVFETPYFYTGTGGQSFSGASYSTNGGATFTDVGPINPGPVTFNFLGGDPGVNCADPNTFYYSQIFDYDDGAGNPWAAVSVNTSTDGGKTWGDPVPAISKSGFYHLLDKPWSTIDPSNHKRIFVSYTDFDFTETNDCGTNFPSRTAIEFVKSDDGGLTWSAPTVAIEVCGAAAVQGSQLAVSSRGGLYISWVNLGSKFRFGPRRIRASFDGGQTWGFAPTKVNSDIQSRLGSGHDHYQSGVAVDKRGYVAVCWYDRRADAENFGIRRHCGESTDQGFSFSDGDIGMNPFAPTHGNDLFINPIYMGDYDQMTSDFLNQNTGFIGAFQNQTTRGNPDVKAHSAQ